MGRIYTVEFENQTIATASGDYDLFEILPATQKPTKLLEIHLANLTEIGDAAEEMLRFRVIRGHTTTGNGTATTARPMNPSDTAYGGTCETVATSIASAGTAVNLASFGWNLRVPLDLYFQPGREPQVANAELLVVRLMAAVTDDVNMSGWICIEEL